MKVYIEDHSTINKSFEVTIDELSLRVDFDDVNHAAVDAAIKQLKKIVEKHWNDEKHRKFFKKELMKIWNENEYGLQNDFDDEGGLEGYLRNNGFKLKDD